MGIVAPDRKEKALIMKKTDEVARMALRVARLVAI